MVHMGLGLIEYVCCSILFMGVACLILGSGLKMGTLGSLVNWVELAKPLNVLLKSPFIAFNFMLYLSLGVVVFGEKLEFAEYTR